MKSEKFNKRLSSYADFKELVPVCITCGRLLRTEESVCAFIEYTASNWSTADWSTFRSKIRGDWCCTKHFLELL
jgi:hypothetical protein